MIVKPLPKTPKLPNGVEDNGALLIRTLFDQLTDINSRVNQLITEIERIKKATGVEE